MIFVSNFDLAGCGGQWRSAGLPSLPCFGRGLSAVIASSCGGGIGGGAELVPLLGPGPMRGQMQNGSALRPGQSGGHGEEVAAQRRTAGGRMAVSGEVPAARSRLCVIAAQIAHAALDANWPDGRWANGPSMTSDRAVSMIACWRWVMSAWVVSSVLLVRNGW